jgi:hypothetical protein
MIMATKEPLHPGMKDKPLPPTRQAGRTYVLTDPTKNASGRGK